MQILPSILCVLGAVVVKQSLRSLRLCVRPALIFFFVSLSAFSWQSNLVALAQGTIAPTFPDPARFESEIAAFEAIDHKNATPPNAILFVGSSSIRLWQTADAFPGLP